MKKIILIGLLLISSLSAKEVFNLTDQYFEKAYKQDTSAAMYDMEKVFVSMTNFYQSKVTGRYFARNKDGETGSILLKLKKPLDDFSVSVYGKYASINASLTPSIVLQSENGKEFVVAFSYNKIMVQNKKFEVKDLGANNLHVNIEKTGNIFVVAINGQTFLKTEIVNFTKMKQLINTIGYGRSYNNRFDSLHNIIITEK